MKTKIYGEPKDYFFHHDISEKQTIDIHLHDAYEVFQTLNHHLVYFVEGTTYTLKKHDIIITNTNEIHRPITNHLKGAYNRRFIQFKPSAFLPFFNSNYNPFYIFETHEKGASNQLSLTREACQEINMLFETLAKLNDYPSPASDLLMKANLVQLFVALEKSQASKKKTHRPGTTDPRITDIIHFINTHYSEKISLASIAKTHFLDKYYLSHLFKENTGFTLQEYLQSKRIKEAKRLIGQGYLITTAAKDCGYSDYSNFYKTFCKLTNQSPKAYQQGLKKGL